jgi:hypothetical protein
MNRKLTLGVAAVAVAAMIAVPAFGDQPAATKSASVLTKVKRALRRSAVALKRANGARFRAGKALTRANGAAAAAAAASSDAAAASSDAAVNAAAIAGLPTVRYAKVDADSSEATILSHVGAASSGRQGTGVYIVTFDEPVTDCGWSATLNDNDVGIAPSGEATVERASAGQTSTLLVSTWNSSGTKVDLGDTDGFTVTVICP